MPEVTNGRLPRWQSHKQVYADKITSVCIIAGANGEDRVEHWELEGGGVIRALGVLRSRVPADVVPVGGYYVRYDDGWESWSPAKPFEEGYARV